MSGVPQPVKPRGAASLHRLRVISGLAAGAWLGARQAGQRRVLSVSDFPGDGGVFIARWTVPMLLKGTGYIALDIREKAHLLVWALLAGVLWAVANTLP
jgi:hypothetical protein